PRLRPRARVESPRGPAVETSAGDLLILSHRTTTMADRSPRRTLATDAVHAGEADRVPGTAVTPPLIQSATFHWSDPDDGPLRYTRHGNNPNQEQVARKMAALEGMDDAAALGSGMAAIAMTLLALTESGDHVVASTGLYG